MGSIKVLTGLDLLSVVSERRQREVESVRPERVWVVGKGDFMEGCKGSRGYVDAEAIGIF